MRHFTDAAAAQIELEDQRVDAPYELILEDGRHIAVPDYPALVKTIGQLQVSSFRVRVRETANENANGGTGRALHRG